MSHERFKELLREKTVLLDGAMGTMLQKAGLAPSAYPDAVNLTNPELVQGVHEKYIAAGSRVIYTNSFSTNKRKLEGSGYTVQAVVEAAVQNARAAAQGKNVLVALDIGPIGELLYPSGTLRFHEAYCLFREVVEYGTKAGADLIAIETMTDLAEARAALLAAKENSDLPVLLTMSFDESGRTFQGVSPVSMAHTLQGLEADAIGVNCSLGPAQLYPIVQSMAAETDLPLIVKANAGLPHPDGSGYDLSADAFAAQMRRFLKLGVQIFGGCCGSDPSFIQALAKALRGEAPRPRAHTSKAVVCSATKMLDLNGRIHVIGERINPTGKKALQQALLKDDMDYVLSEAIAQEKNGAAILDINMGLPGIDEVAMMERAVAQIQGVCDLPLQIDSADICALEAGLRAFHGVAIVNSVNGEKESLESVLPLAKKYGACVIGLTLDENGLPDTAEQRFQIAERILQAALSHGIPREKVFIDCLTLTVSAQQAQAMETLRATKMVRERLSLQTVLGVSNISFGLPAREQVNQAFLLMALSHGLTLPIINPALSSLMNAVAAFEVLSGMDQNAGDYIKRLGNAQKVEKSAVPVKEADPASLSAAIENGLGKEAGRITKALLATMKPMEIIERLLIPALDLVGESYEKGQSYLPQLLASAGAAESAFGVLKAAMEKEGNSKVSAGKILLATVQGDIHDIGKNIVKVVLENYGFEVYDLGRDVPPQQVVESAVKHDIPLVGLSALMTTTLPAMQKTIEALRESGHPCKVMVGGAVLTAQYARQIGADFYARDAKQSADIAKEYFS